VSKAIDYSKLTDDETLILRSSLLMYMQEIHKLAAMGYGLGVSKQQKFLEDLHGVAKQMLPPEEPKIELPPSGIVQ
jgi:hypothetical protein